MSVPNIGRGPVSASDFYERGWRRLREHDPARAVNNFTRALELDSNNVSLYCDRARAHAQMGEMAHALDDWRTAIERDWHTVFDVYYAQRRFMPDDIALDKLISEIVSDRLHDLDIVSGYAVGYSAAPGEFYTASLILSAHLGDEDFLRMTDSQNPVVCARALIVLARRDLARYQTTIQSFYDEGTEVMYMPAGCGVSRISLGELARSIVEDSETLQYWDPEKTRWLWQRQR